MRSLTHDSELVEQMKKDYRQANLDERTQAALEFAEKMTRTPAQMTSEDVERLRAAGFDDKGIVGVAHVAAHFNYMNRIADALGCQL